MTLFQLVFTYIVTYSILLFILLPIGIRPITPEKAMDYAGAPANPRFVTKLLINIPIAAAVTGLIYLAITQQWVPIQEVY